MLGVLAGPESHRAEGPGCRARLELSEVLGWTGPWGLREVREADSGGNAQGDPVCRVVRL